MESENKRLVVNLNTIYDADLLELFEADDFKIFKNKSDFARSGMRIAAPLFAEMYQNQGSVMVPAIAIKNFSQKITDKDTDYVSKDDYEGLKKSIRKLEESGVVGTSSSDDESNQSSKRKPSSNIPKDFLGLGIGKKDQPE